MIISPFANVLMRRMCVDYYDSIVAVDYYVDEQSKTNRIYTIVIQVDIATKSDVRDVIDKIYQMIKKLKEEVSK